MKIRIWRVRDVQTVQIEFLIDWRVVEQIERRTVVQQRFGALHVDVRWLVKQKLADRIVSLPANRGLLIVFLFAGSHVGIRCLEREGKKLLFFSPVNGD